MPSLGSTRFPLSLAYPSLASLFRPRPAIAAPATLASYPCRQSALQRPRSTPSLLCLRTHACAPYSTTCSLVPLASQPAPSLPSRHRARANVSKPCPVASPAPLARARGCPRQRPVPSARTCSTLLGCCPRHLLALCAHLPRPHRSPTTLGLSALNRAFNNSLPLPSPSFRHKRTRAPPLSLPLRPAHPR